MNSTFGNNEYDSFCYNFSLIYYNYIKTPILIIGTIANIICVAIFYKLIRNSTQNDNLNKYLLIKSIADTYISIQPLITKLFNLSKSDKSYFYQVFNLIFFNYFLVISELMSMFLEVASILNRYFTFTKINKKLEKIGFKSAVIFMLVYSFGFYSYKFFDLKISSVVDYKTNETYFKLNTNKLGGIGIILGYIHSTVRDGICVLLLFILNILTLIKLRKVMKKKANLQSKSLAKDKKATKTGFRLTMMVVATTTITFFNVVLMIIKYANINVINSNDCFLAFISFTFFMCNSVNFVLYFYFNLNFKRIFLSVIYFKNIFRCKYFS